MSAEFGHDQINIRLVVQWKIEHPPAILVAINIFTFKYQINTSNIKIKYRWDFLISLFIY